jgi:hypothetical protein
MMKKTIVLSMVLLMGTLVYGQINPHALGLRFGGGNTVNTEFSYQRGLSSTNRLEADLGLEKRSKIIRAFSLCGYLPVGLGNRVRPLVVCRSGWAIRPRGEKMIISNVGS